MTDIAPKKRRGLGESKTSSRLVKAALRHMEAVKLRTEGLTYLQIAQRLGYADRSDVFRVVKQTLMTAQQDAAEELRAIENERLDMGLRAIEPYLKHKNPLVRLRAHQELIRNSQRRAQLNGLEAPVKAPVGPDGQPVIPHVTVIYERESRHDDDIGDDAITYDTTALVDYRADAAPASGAAAGHP